MEYKADANIKNEFDKIPLEEALQNGFADIGVTIFKVYKLLYQEVLDKVSVLSDEKIKTSI